MRLGVKFLPQLSIIQMLLIFLAKTSISKVFFFFKADYWQMNFICGIYERFQCWKIRTYIAHSL